MQWCKGKLPKCMLSGCNLRCAMFTVLQFLLLIFLEFVIYLRCKPGMAPWPFPVGWAPDSCCSPGEWMEGRRIRSATWFLLGPDFGHLTHLTDLTWQAPWFWEFGTTFGDLFWICLCPRLLDLHHSTGSPLVDGLKKRYLKPEKPEKPTNAQWSQWVTQSGTVLDPAPKHRRIPKNPEENSSKVCRICQIIWTSWEFP